MNTQTQSNCSSSQESSPRTRSEVFRPLADMAENASGLQLHLDMPGTKAEHIALEVEGNELRVHAHVPSRVTGSEFLSREYAVGDFRRTFLVDDALDLSNVDAEYKHGVLTITIQKKKEIQPRKISVRAD